MNPPKKRIYRDPLKVDQFKVTSLIRCEEDRLYSLKLVATAARELLHALNSGLDTEQYEARLATMLRSSTDAQSRYDTKIKELQEETENEKQFKGD